MSGRGRQPVQRGAAGAGNYRLVGTLTVL